MAKNSNQDSGDEMTRNIQEIPLSSIDPFPNHPFKVKDDEDMQNLVESIAQNGLLAPIIVRKMYHKRYEIISGHRRLRAFQILGLEKIPAEVLNISKEEATLYMIDSNFQRSTILPSEKAFAYKMRMEAIRDYKWRVNEGRLPKQPTIGATRLPLEGKAKDILAKTMGESHETIRRYIRLTKLVPDLLEMVDNGNLGLRSAVELSYIKTETQQTIADQIGIEISYPTLAQAIRMRKLDENNELTESEINKIMREQKPNQKEHDSVRLDRFEKLFPKRLPLEKREAYIEAALEHYGRYLARKERDYER